MVPTRSQHSQAALCHWRSCLRNKWTSSFNPFSGTWILVEAHYLHRCKRDWTSSSLGLLVHSLSQQIFTNANHAPGLVLPLISNGGMNQTRKERQVTKSRNSFFGNSGLFLVFPPLRPSTSMKGHQSRRGSEEPLRESFYLESGAHWQYTLHVEWPPEKTPSSSTAGKVSV